MLVLVHNNDILQYMYCKFFLFFYCYWCCLHPCYVVKPFILHCKHRIMLQRVSKWYHWQCKVEIITDNSWTCAYTCCVITSWIVSIHCTMHSGKIINVISVSQNDIEITIVRLQFYFTLHRSLNCVLFAIYGNEIDA